LEIVHYIAIFKTV